jgi:RIO kinase 2
MRYLTKDEYRVLTAVEMGMRNHELVPLELITSIAKLRHGGSSKIISNLLRYKLVAHEANNYNGYRLSYLGYDILALKALANRGKVVSVGKQIGVGKESDIFEAMDENGEEVVVKIHRLGRTSFRAVRRHRDYMNNKSKASWLYMSRLAAIKEFAFMQVLYANGFPTPVPMDQNRHVVVMNRIHGFPLAQIKAGKMEGAEAVFNKCTAILKRLGQFGLVHCDFNEFNLMTDESGNVTLIDFPQMVSVSHPNAEELFSRDMNCLIKFFAMKMHYVPPEEARIYLKDIVTDVNVYNAAISDNVGSQDDSLLLDYMKASGGDGGGAGEDSEGEKEASEDEDDESIIIDGPQERIADLIRPENAEGRVLAAAEAAAAVTCTAGSDVSDLEDREGDEDGEDSAEDADITQEIRQRVQR